MIEIESDNAVVANGHNQPATGLGVPNLTKLANDLAG